jgi:hypothetical protein
LEEAQSVKAEAGFDGPEKAFSGICKHPLPFLSQGSFADILWPSSAFFIIQRQSFVLCNQA